MSADLLRRAAAKIRESAPLIEYTAEMSAPDRVKYVQYRRTPRTRWGWRNNIRPALRTLFPKSTSVDHLLDVKWWQRPSFAWYTLTYRETRDRPEAALDGGNVLIFWSEVAQHIALWSPDVAELVASLLEEAAHRYESLQLHNLDLREVALSKEEASRAVETELALARRILGEGA